MTSQLFIGGKKYEEDLIKYQKEIPNIIIATPGRILDFIEKEKISLSNLEILILDEADRMLDMGFELTVSNIISKLPKQRRTGLFSATVTSNVENLIKAGMRNPEFINIVINQNKTKRIPKDELKKLIRIKSFTSIGKMFNVTDNAIRKWCDFYNLPRTKKEINSLSDKEWELL